MAPLDRKLAERIADGRAELLGIDEVVTRIGVSRSTLERWIRKSKELTLMERVQNQAARAGMSLPSGNGFSARNTQPMFPSPDLYIGASPKWLKETVINWLIANSS